VNYVDFKMPGATIKIIKNILWEVAAVVQATTKQFF
jgi:hypothetical protein